MGVVHVKHQTVFAVLVKDPVVIVERQRAYNNTGRVNRLGNTSPDKSVKVVEDIGMCFSCGVWIFLIFFFDFVYVSDAVLFFVFASKTTPDFLNDGFVRQCSVSSDSCRLILAEPLCDVLKYCGAIFFYHVDVDITDLFSILISESRKNRMPLLWVYIDNVCDICTSRSTNRSATGTDRHSLTFAPPNELAHAEHESTHVKFLKNPKFFLDCFAKGVFLVGGNDSVFQLVVKRTPYDFFELFLVCLLRSVQDRVLYTSVDVVRLTQLIELVRSVDCLHVNLFWKRVLYAEVIDERIVITICKIE